MLDRFTVGHVAAGTLFALGRVPWWAALAMSVGFELIENALKRKSPALFPSRIEDSWAHAAVDVTAVMAGYGAIKLLPPRKNP
jgi:hypothetical protein